LAALAKAKPPAGQVEGRSLLPLIDDPQTAWEDRYLFTHKGRWKTGEEPNEYQWRNFAVRNQRFRMVGTEALFDMEKDPSQTTNVIGQYPEVANEMRAAYDEWWKGTRPLMVNEDAPMSPTRPFHELHRQQMAAGGIPAWQPPAL
jgi:arylsulfatase